MIQSQTTPFLDLATGEAPEALRRAVHSEFEPKLSVAASEFEFDLHLWSVAQRLSLDTEELLRQAGGRWIERPEVARGLTSGQDSQMGLECVGALIADLENLPLAPLPGWPEFKVSVLSSTDERLRLRCEGPRRCCSFLEGMARNVTEASGQSLRYIRQPMRATLVTLTLSCI